MYCCKKYIQSNFKFCPHCGQSNPMWKGIKKPKVYRIEGNHLSATKLVAIKSSEFRPPKKGEYFLSGTIPIAYLAPNNLTQQYRIMTVMPAEDYRLLNIGIK